jgi:hypothetical protein
MKKDKKGGWKLWEAEEEDISSYWMTLKKRVDTKKLTEDAQDCTL